MKIYNGASTDCRPRPVCVCCGKSYGQEVITWWSIEHSADGHKELPPKHLKLLYFYTDKIPTEEGHRWYKTHYAMWDNKTFTKIKFKPWCSQKCLLVHARKIYKELRRYEKAAKELKG